MGRHRIDKDELRTHPVLTYISKTKYRKMQKVINFLDISASELVNRALSKYLDNFPE